MEVPIGEQNLGELARRQLDWARRDPRLEHGREAMVADFWAAIEEAERSRTVAILGLHELEGAYEREEQALGDDADDHALRKLQAVWERSELAGAAIKNGYPTENAQALISLNSALDALVEQFAPAMRNIQIRAVSDKAFYEAEEEHPEAVAQLTDEIREHLRGALRDVLANRLPKLERLTGSGVERYEARLRPVGLGVPPDRPIPEDLDRSLTELGALRDVLIHRAGRVDEKALKQAPSLRYDEGELVRITRDDYRIYSAALRCYGEEVTFRPFRGWKQASDEERGPDLNNWRGYYIVGV